MKLRWSHGKQGVARKSVAMSFFIVRECYEYSGQQTAKADDNDRLN